MIKKINVLSVLLAMVYLCHAAELMPAARVRLTGHVQDGLAEPVIGARVSVGNIATTSTNLDGGYAFQIKPGRYVISVSSLGYEEETREVEITSDTIINFTLKETATELSGIEVVGKNASQRMREGTFAATSLDIRALAGSVTDISDVIDRSAGVKVRREGGVGSDFDLSINGLSGNSVRYFIDGVPIDSKGGEVRIDNLPVNLVNRVDIYKGVVPAWLGADALGGAVNIITNRSRNNFIDASYGVGSFHTQTADVAGQIRIPKTAVLIRPSFGINYSKNNYMMKNVEVWDEETHQYIFTNRRRFHDDYFSLLAQIEAGVSDVSWADQFFISGSYSNVRKELQTGAMQNKVYGMAERRGHAWSVAMRYAKAFDKLQTSLNFSHTWDHTETVDTAYRKYSWDGTYQPSSGNEINNRARTWRIYKRPITLLNIGLDYTFNEHNSLALNYSLNRTGNDRYDKVDNTFEPSNDVLTKHIIGLTYSQIFLDSRLQNTFFLKDYINAAMIRQSDLSWITGSEDVKGHTVRNYWGGGLGSRFRIFLPLSVKASFEHSVRLPLSRELLGNGTTIYPNLTLNPENSNNLNVGLFGTWNFANGDHEFNYEATFFLRHVKDYIRASVSEKEGMMQYENIPAVHINGFDFDLGYTWRNALHIGINGTYTDARDLKKYKTDGKPSATYKNRVPNKPWAFINADASYTFHDLICRTDRLRIGYTYQWIHWYFLNWEAYGALESKARITTQNISGIDLTYSLNKDKYSVSFQIDNLFDALAYDNYMLQKPGRSFLVKFRVFIN